MKETAFSRSCQNPGYVLRVRTVRSPLSGSSIALMIAAFDQKKWTRKVSDLIKMRPIAPICGRLEKLQNMGKSTKRNIGIITMGPLGKDLYSLVSRDAMRTFQAG